MLIKNAILGRTKTYASLRREIIKVINECVKDLESEELKRVSALSLMRFAEQMLSQSLIGLGVPVATVLLAYDYLRTGATFENVIKELRVQIKPGVSQETYELGVPTQVYEKDYTQKVEEVLDTLSKQEAKYDERISLRNVAEMTVRYERTMDSINEFKSKGINLVVSSRHANCSKRCQEWQGGHYTLDNTYQIVDGIEFQPISNATDQYYTTKKGKTYKNGHITGYNCRHYLMAYKKGLSQPEISADVIAKQRKIDQTMRSMERQIREWKDKALLYKGQNKEKYDEAKFKATAYNKRYIEFAKKNSRPYYPSRTDIF